MSHHIVETNALCYTYPASDCGIRDISFRITHGESVAFVGENGAGKSTLLHHLNGFLEPTAGSVSIGDYPINKKNLQAVRRSVGMVFQDPDDQLFMPTVLDDVAFGPLNLGMPSVEAEAAALEALGRVGAAHLKDRPPYRLSGGEKRSVAIATVLAMQPDILVMDEPSSNLDPRARQRLIILLQSFKHTKIIATHDLDLAMDLCERTIVMHKGRLTADGPTREIFQNNELLESSGLTQPLKMQGCPICGEKLKEITTEKNEREL